MNIDGNGSTQENSLEYRLSILRQNNMLSDENYGRVQNIVSFFYKEHGIKLTEDNSSAFITHLCAAFERIDKNEAIEELDDEVYEMTKSEPTFDKALQISLELKKLYPMLPDAELKFITMHMGVILGTM
jgi:transcriptional antiterminator